MSESTPTKIIGMPSAYVSEDGTLIELKFESAEGDIIHLSFDAERFQELSGRAIELFTHARNQILAKGDHLAIQAVEVEAAAATSVVGGGKVLLSLIGGKGPEYHFALTPQEAESLRPQLHRAAKSASKQASQSRH